MDIMILVLVVVLSALSIHLHDMLASTAALSVFSLLITVVWVYLQAPDVAFTEAVVGAGISTVLMLAAIAKTKRFEERFSQHESFLGKKLVALTSSVLFGGFLLWIFAEMPSVGQRNIAHDNVNVALHYLSSFKQSNYQLGEIGVRNIVTAVLADYRAFDTLGETTVIFTAALCLIVLLRRQRPQVLKKAQKSPGALWLLSPLRRSSKSTSLKGESSIVHSVIRIAIPLIQTFSLYVLFNGKDSVGGAFQAGVIFASSFILWGLTSGWGNGQRFFPRALSDLLIATGVLIYVLIGVVPMLYGGAFLQFDALGPEFIDNIKQHSIGIMIVEIGIFTCVCASMVTLFFELSRPFKPNNKYQEGQ